MAIFGPFFSLKADHDMNIVREILSPLIAVIAAFIVGGLIIALLGDNPFEAYGLLLSNSFGSVRDIGWTLHLATPLIFTGLAVAVAFRGGLLNIGADGQLYVAAFAAAWTGIEFPSAGRLLIPMCCVAAVAAGAAWASIPGFLKARFGSHEVINTIMM